MRLLVGMISHETNTFSNIAAGRQQFAERTLQYGDDVLREFEGTRTSIGGFIEEAQRQGVGLQFTIAASAAPSGLVDRGFYQHVLDEVLKDCTPDIDGVLLALHGAMVVDGIDDAEGEFLHAVRRKIGLDRPVVATLDLHANVSQAMVANADVLVSFKTYPHVDAYERAIEAAKYAISIARGEIHPTAAFVQPRMMPPVQGMLTLRGPMYEIMQKAVELEQSPGVISVSVCPGFPYADIADAGFSAYAVSDNNSQLAEQVVKELADLAWELRRDFIPACVSPPEAVKTAMGAKEGPVVLADVADNPGGGGVGDGTAVLRELIRQGAKDAAIGTIWDPQAVRIAAGVGQGKRVALRIGGKTDRFHGEPLDVEGIVHTISDGEFIHKGPMSTGAKGHLGPAVVLDVDGIKVILNSYRVQTLDPEVFRSVGIEPTACKTLVVKSSIHYRASFEPIASEIIEVDAPGLVSPDLGKFPYRKLRRPMFPLDEI